MICPKCKEKVFLRDDCPSCGYRFFPEKKEQDDLLPFREAARLGCKDFEIEGKNLVFIQENYDRDVKWAFPNSIAGINRQAAACAYWFWMQEYRKLAVIGYEHGLNKTQAEALSHAGMMEKLIVNWAAKHCAPEKKESPLSDEQKIEILWRERKT